MRCAASNVISFLPRNLVDKGRPVDPICGIAFSTAELKAHGQSAPFERCRLGAGRASKIDGVETDQDTFTRGRNRKLAELSLAPQIPFA